ncbi:MAG: HAD family phosphatase [Lagierella massiliensis]|nr:HAD family phosphatase [Lagierella massiliensis]
MVKGIIFDMDGVLINSEIYYFNSLIELIESDGNKVDRESFKQIVGLSGNESKKVISRYYNHDFDHKDFMLRFRKNYMGDNIYYGDILFPYVSKTLKNLKEKGYKLGLASSSSMRTINQAVTQCNIKEYFDFIIGGDKVENPKPDSEIYLKAIDGLGLKSEDCVAVEDSFVGIKAAKNAGLYTIARRDNDFSINQTGADIILEDMNLFNTIIEILSNNKTSYKYSLMEYGTKLYLKAHILSKKVRNLNLNSKKPFRLALEDKDNLVGYLEKNLNSKKDCGKVFLNPKYENMGVKEELEDSLRRINEFYL